MKFFDYEVHKKLTNADYLHENGFFVGNSQVDLENGISTLHQVLVDKN
jgi:CDP-4-dehydro-6-deoxyglucose reductase, E1